MNSRKTNNIFENIDKTIKTSVSRNEILELNTKIDALMKILSQKDPNFINEYKSTIYDIKNGFSKVASMNTNYRVDSFYQDGMNQKNRVKNPSDVIFEDKIENDDDFLIHSINNQTTYN